MTIANCPRCCEQVSVPSDASREATVQCPLCQEEYSLDEALSKLPPALLIISDPGAESVTSLDSGEAASSLLADEDDTPWTSLSVDSDDTDDVTLAPIDDDKPAAPFDFAEPSTSSGVKKSTTIRPSTRSRKPKGSPIKSVLSIVIGGLMAFPIAQLILWYLPGDLKRDFGAGPVVAQYIPAIVPAKFRGDAAANESNSEPTVEDSDSSIPDFNFGGTGEFAGDGATNDAQTQPKKKRKSRQQQPPPNEAAAQIEPALEESMDIDEAAAAGADVFGSDVEVPTFEPTDLPGISVAAPEEMLEEPPTTAEPELTSEPELIVEEAATSPLPPFEDALPKIDAPVAEVSAMASGTIRNAPSVTASDVVATFQSALEANLAWDTDEEGSPSIALKKQFYSSFSKLGEALTFAEKADETVVSQTSETARLLHEIGKQPDKLSVISAVANGWMTWSRDDRGTNGVCIFGTVKSVTPNGELFESTIEAGGKQIAIVSTSDPSEHFVAGQDVLVLGTILEDPTKNLGGYEGSHAKVVLDGYHVAVAKE